ncbi:hypothetical protein OR1_03694 [Geobacter sp. OR-1]|uniref:hypothetical protein n=1 Tax=Geobacter sp. OR-1 TaxID=1266765 RepID=UPI000542B321|nr:hypothetical protein [Geobacter sp. OR-1]GAM11379.1 hypothetical protein OR1_03694 [Geobacter sp. OR-1]
MSDKKLTFDDVIQNDYAMMMKIMDRIREKEIKVNDYVINQLQLIAGLVGVNIEDIFDERVEGKGNYKLK